MRLDSASVEEIEETLAAGRERLNLIRDNKAEESDKEQGGLVIYLVSTQIRFVAQPDTIVLCDFGFNVQDKSQAIRWDESNKGEDTIVQIFQMVCTNSLEEGLLTFPDTAGVSTLFDKKSNCTVPLGELRSILAPGVDKAFEVRPQASNLADASGNR